MLASVTLCLHLRGSNVPARRPGARAPPNLPPTQLLILTPHCEAAAPLQFWERVSLQALLYPQANGLLFPVPVPAGCIVTPVTARGRCPPPPRPHTAAGEGSEKKFSFSGCLFLRDLFFSQQNWEEGTEIWVNPHGCIRITQSPQFTSGFTLGAV